MRASGEGGRAKATCSSRKCRKALAHGEHGRMCVGSTTFVGTYSSEPSLFESMAAVTVSLLQRLPSSSDQVLLQYVEHPRSVVATRQIFRPAFPCICEFEAP